MTFASDSATRELKPAMLRGARGRCPRCGEGNLFSKYLKIRSACPDCGLDLTHQRTDDGPAYITILIVGHIGVFLLTTLVHHMSERPLALALIMSGVCLVLSLLLLPRVKGGMVGLQWAKRMHGF